MLIASLPRLVPIDRRPDHNRLIKLGGWVLCAAGERVSWACGWAVGIDRVCSVDLEAREVVIQ